jgi:flagellar biogenesis protein FliO
MMLRSVTRTVKLCWSLAVVWPLWAGTAWAAGQPLGALQPYQVPAPVLPSINIGGLILQLVFSLAIVIGLALILIKFLQKNSLLSRQSTWARVVDQVSVGPNRMLVLTEIFGKVYVLGVTEHSIATLLGENEIDLSLVKQAFAEAENRKKIVPSYLGNPFRGILESRIEDLKRRYESKWKDGSPR